MEKRIDGMLTSKMEEIAERIAIAINNACYDSIMNAEVFEFEIIPFNSRYGYLVLPGLEIWTIQD